MASFLDDSDDEGEGEVAIDATQAPAEEDEIMMKCLALPVSPKDIDPLGWHRNHSAILPQFSKMARQFLGAPVSTAGVERSFSACGQMHSNLRKCLEEGTIQHSMMPSMNT